MGLIIQFVLQWYMAVRAMETLIHFQILKH